MNCIFLIGYMGSGKTTIGKLVAERLGYQFVDMDEVIEKKHHLTISQIFAEKGETTFREIEKDCLHEVSGWENVIISTGGGTPCFFDNIDYMNSRGLTIYLQLSTNELAERLELIGLHTRPLLAGKNSEELRQFIAEGLSKREFFYQQAAHTLSGSIDWTVDEICRLIKKN